MVADGSRMSLMIFPTRSTRQITYTKQHRIIISLVSVSRMSSFPSIDESNNYCVEAIAIDETCIYFKCPRCIYRKKPVIHQHGSGNNFKLRHEHRIAHCVPGEYSIDKSINGVHLHITENTRNISHIIRKRRLIYINKLK